jgi:hypothetical protein
MAHTASHQFSQSLSRRLTEGADEIITIDVEQFFVFLSLKFISSLRNMS